MMFDILSVNAYGSQTLMKLKKDGSELKLGGVCTCMHACVPFSVAVCLVMYVSPYVLYVSTYIRMCVCYVEVIAQ